MSHDGHRSSGLHPGLHNQDEAEAIESVIRTAVDAVLSVMCGAYNRRMLEYQRMVADRDKEIWSLKCKLQKSELDEETMQMPEDELPCSATCRSNASLSGEEVNQLKTEPEEKCCDVGAVTPTLISPDCRDTMGAFPHQRAPSAAVFEESDAGAAGAQSPGWATVKEDDPGPVIEWEMCEESCADLQQSAGGVAHYQKPANIGSHRVFEDLYAFFACTSAECVFCRVKHPATEGHLQRKHLKEAMFFIHQGKEKFVVACLCSDSASQSKRSHYHCPFCRYRSFKRDLNFKHHLQKLHGITAEKKKGLKNGQTLNQPT